MLGITELKNGTAIIYEGQPHIVMAYEHSKMGRGGAVLRTKLRNLKTGAIFDITFKGADKFDEAQLSRRLCTYLYPEDSGFAFMDTENFDQFTVSKETVGRSAQYMKEGVEVTVLFFDEKPVTVEIPLKVELQIAHAEPGVKGNTASGGTKPATLETGAVITVPLFVETGEMVRVNTAEGTYVERVRS